jgi:3-hydroxybutyryl-CoA dehydrogenase
MFALKDQKVALLGTGTMGSAIALLFAHAGAQVTLWGRSDKSLATATDAFAVAPAPYKDAAPAVTLTTCLEDIRGAFVVLETVAEDLAVKHDLLRRVEPLVPETALIVSNTSSISITKIAACLAHPGRFCGQHFFNPATLIPGVEVIRGDTTTDATMDAVVALTKGLGKSPIRVNRDIPGFLGNRLQVALQREAFRLYADGVASLDDLDRAVTELFGPRLALYGVMLNADLGGLDIFKAIAEQVYPTLEDAKGPSPLLEKLCAEGAVGAKAGRGFQPYTEAERTRLIQKRNDFLKRLFTLRDEMTTLYGPTVP